MCSFTRSYTRKDNNNFKDMKTKRKFVSPQVKVAETYLEGLICLSAFKAVNVDEHRNVNKSIKDGDYTSEPLYFEF